MSILSAADIAELRAVQEATFIDTCTIVSATEANASHTWNGELDVICGVSSPSRAAQTGQPVLDVGSDERQMVFGFPVGTSIRQGWVIQWNARDFEVTSLEEPGTYDMQITAIGLERR